MKKGFLLMLLISCFAFFTFLSSASAAGDSDFTKAVNEKLKEINYYANGSAEIVNSISKEAEITKVVTSDDPETKENEEEIDTYKANVVVGHVAYKLKRDSIFYIQKHEFFYYDVDNQEFLMLGNFPEDEEINALFKEYMDAGHKAGISLTSNLLFTLFALLAFLAVPTLIMMFHNKAIPVPMVRNNSVM
ncbi:hypothetical protein RGU12_18005 [Fredinandcohnia sp. QZ13]|uniref:hypothetical protein n=1 Tax=Fredinandcohnia sp. QZ13 TaxID=3073144 RepID=UPI0028531A54|nr:hypothetical protein [Fredinandcohnia sp. QZ13]MDR4889388.1 hypothetical protein [Fredinandcohnia sp. QZ13]